MDWPKTVAIVVSVLALAGVVVLQSNGIHSSINSLRVEAANDRANAAADRRAHQDSMDTFREQLLAIAVEQAAREGAKVADQ